VSTSAPTTPYAEQAAVWHKLTQGISRTEAVSVRRRLQRWHEQNAIYALRGISSIHGQLTPHT